MGSVFWDLLVSWCCYWCCRHYSVSRLFLSLFQTHADRRLYPFHTCGTNTHGSHCTCMSLELYRMPRSLRIVSVEPYMWIPSYCKPLAVCMYAAGGEGLQRRGEREWERERECTHLCACMQESAYANPQYVARPHNMQRGGTPPRPDEILTWRNSQQINGRVGILFCVAPSSIDIHASMHS